MSERWRKPLTVVAIEVHPTEGILLPDGREQSQVRITYDRESTERIRGGWACAKCGEPFPEAWPEQCDVCGAPIRSRQLEYYTREVEIEMPPSRPSLAEEADSIRERVEEEGI